MIKGNKKTKTKTKLNKNNNLSKKQIMSIYEKSYNTNIISNHETKINDIYKLLNSNINVENLLYKLNIFSAEKIKSISYTEYKNKLFFNRINIRNKVDTFFHDNADFFDIILNQMTYDELKPIIIQHGGSQLSEIGTQFLDILHLLDRKHDFMNNSHDSIATYINDNTNQQINTIIANKTLANKFKKLFETPSNTYEPDITNEILNNFIDGSYLKNGTMNITNFTFIDIDDSKTSFDIYKDKFFSEKNNVKIEDMMNAIKDKILAFYKYTETNIQKQKFILDIDISNKNLGGFEKHLYTKFAQQLFPFENAFDPHPSFQINLINNGYSEVDTYNLYTRITNKNFNENTMSTSSENAYAIRNNTKKFFSFGYYTIYSSGASKRIYPYIGFKLLNSNNIRTINKFHTYYNGLSSLFTICEYKLHDKVIFAYCPKAQFINSPASVKNIFGFYYTKSFNTIDILQKFIKNVIHFYNELNSNTKPNAANESSTAFENFINIAQYIDPLETLVIDMIIYIYYISKFEIGANPFDKKTIITIYENIINILFDLKKAGDWGQSLFCSTYNIFQTVTNNDECFFVSGDRLSAMRSILAVNTKTIFMSDYRIFDNPTNHNLTKSVIGIYNNIPDITFGSLNNYINSSIFSSYAFKNVIIPTSINSSFFYNGMQLNDDDVKQLKIIYNNTKLLVTSNINIDNCYKIILIIIIKFITWLMNNAVVIISSNVANGYYIDNSSRPTIITPIEIDILMLKPTTYLETYITDLKTTYPLFNQVIELYLQDINNYRKYIFLVSDFNNTTPANSIKSFDINTLFNYIYHISDINNIYLNLLCNTNDIISTPVPVPVPVPVPDPVPVPASVPVPDIEDLQIEFDHCRRIIDKIKHINDTIKINDNEIQIKILSYDREYEELIAIFEHMAIVVLNANKLDIYNDIMTLIITNTELYIDFIDTIVQQYGYSVIDVNKKQKLQEYINYNRLNFKTLGGARKKAKISPIGNVVYSNIKNLLIENSKCVNTFITNFNQIYSNDELLKNTGITVLEELIAKNKCEITIFNMMQLNVKQVFRFLKTYNNEEIPSFIIKYKSKKNCDNIEYSYIHDLIHCYLFENQFINIKPGNIINEDFIELQHKIKKEHFEYNEIQYYLYLLNIEKEFINIAYICKNSNYYNTNIDNIIKQNDISKDDKKILIDDTQNIIAQLQLAIINNIKNILAKYILYVKQLKNLISEAYFCTDTSTKLNQYNINIDFIVDKIREIDELYLEIISSSITLDKISENIIKIRENVVAVELFIISATGSVVDCKKPNNINTTSSEKSFATILFKQILNIKQSEIINKNIIGFISIILKKLIKIIFYFEKPEHNFLLLIDKYKQIWLTIHLLKEFINTLTISYNDYETTSYMIKKARKMATNKIHKDIKVINAKKAFDDFITIQTPPARASQHIKAQYEANKQEKKRLEEVLLNEIKEATEIYGILFYEISILLYNYFIKDILLFKNIKLIESSSHDAATVATVKNAYTYIYSDNYDTLLLILSAKSHANHYNIKELSIYLHDKLKTLITLNNRYVKNIATNYTNEAIKNTTYFSDYETTSENYTVVKYIYENAKNTVNDKLKLISKNDSIMDTSVPTISIDSTIIDATLANSSSPDSPELPVTSPAPVSTPSIARSRVRSSTPSPKLRTSGVSSKILYEADIISIADKLIEKKYDLIASANEIKRTVIDANHYLNLTTNKNLYNIEKNDVANNNIFKQLCILTYISKAFNDMIKTTDVLQHLERFFNNSKSCAICNFIKLHNIQYFFEEEYKAITVLHSYLHFMIYTIIYKFFHKQPYDHYNFKSLFKSSVEPNIKKYMNHLDILFKYIEHKNIKEIVKIQLDAKSIYIKQQELIVNKRQAFNVLKANNIKKPKP